MELWSGTWWRTRYQQEPPRKLNLIVVMLRYWVEGNHTKLLQRPAHCTKGCFKNATRILDIHQRGPDSWGYIWKQDSNLFLHKIFWMHILRTTVLLAFLKHPTAQALAPLQPHGSPLASETFQKLLLPLCEGCWVNIVDPRCLEIYSHIHNTHQPSGVFLLLTSPPEPMFNSNRSSSHYHICPPFEFTQPNLTLVDHKSYSGLL